MLDGGEVGSYAIVFSFSFSSLSCTLGCLSAHANYLGLEAYQISLECFLFICIVRTIKKTSFMYFYNYGRKCSRECGAPIN